MASRNNTKLATINTYDLTGLIYSPISAEISKPFSRQIFLLEVYVAGCNHVRYIKKYLSEMQKGDRVILLREPKNKYDELAILVKNEKRQKLGYVPRVKNDAIARLMDAGKLLYGIVTDIREPDDREFPWKAVQIAIYMED